MMSGKTQSLTKSSSSESVDSLKDYDSDDFQDYESDDEEETQKKGSHKLTPNTARHLKHAVNRHKESDQDSIIKIPPTKDTFSLSVLTPTMPIHDKQITKGSASTPVSEDAYKSQPKGKAPDLSKVDPAIRRMVQQLEQSLDLLRNEKSKLMEEISKLRQQRELDVKSFRDILAKKGQGGSMTFLADNRKRMLNAPRPPVSGNYELATHTVKVKRSGAVADVIAMWDLEGTSAMSGSSHKEMDKEKKARYKERLSSLDAFNQKAHPNLMLNGLRYFECAIQGQGANDKDPYSWGKVAKTSLKRCILGLCDQAKELFQAEPRLVRLEGPVFILGDVHGNFHDLVCFEKVLWRVGPLLTPCAFLFLGDYVDRGEHGVEVIAYLLAQKVLAPTKFFLLRGNHELRAVQEMFTFKRECLEKFGEPLGLQIWETFNEVFDRMPIAATVDDRLFGCHGGIPAPISGNCVMLDEIDDVMSPLRDPETESSIAWEIMWNDPINVEQSMKPDVKREMEENNGFAYNMQRRTGHAWSFEALERFLTKNKLSHVIRAHEVKQAGFQVLQQGRLLTVFSSSHYCGGSNEAACILADRYKLRTMRLDTTPGESK